MVKRKGGGKKQVLHLSEFLGDAAPVTPAAPPVWTDECPTDLSLPGLLLFIASSLNIFLIRQKHNNRYNSELVIGQSHRPLLILAPIRQLFSRASSTRIETTNLLIVLYSLS